jgi:hypothetical protein
MYEELRHPFTVRWAREAGFGAKSLMRLQCGGLMAATDQRKLRLLDAAPEQVATTAVGPLVALGWRSAALWYGWPLLHQPTEIELVVPRRRSPTPWPGARLIRQQLSPDEVIRMRDVPVTRPLRAAVDLALHLPMAEVLAVLDGACRLGGVTTSGLRRELRRTESPRARLAADLINPERASVYESLFFLLLFEAGVPTPVCQLVVRHEGASIRPDFAWPHRRVIAEIDGFAHHSDRAAFQADRRRQNALINAGRRVLRFTPADLLERPEAVMSEVRAALRLPL